MHFLPPKHPTVVLLAATLATILAASAPPSLSAAPQVSSRPASPDWNSARVLDLVQRGRDRRSTMASDSTLRSWRAEADGHVYFLLEEDRTGDRSLIKADQLALEVFWRAPDHVRQHIVGRRDEARLPTDIVYHLDHLTVVTDDFDDRITLGDGDEIRSVVHPLAPASGATYDFQLGDSLTVTFPGRGEEIRVYEVRIRPKDAGQPGVVGSVYLDRGSAAVVRMGLTFTPSSYVDPLLDHIRLTLDNGLWEGRYWLPYRQEMEIRRELPYLDLPAGTVIRARYDIGSYTLNPDLPRSFFAGPSIRSRPDDALASYPFEEGLFAHLDEEGLAPTPDLEDVRRRAGQMLVEERLSGLSRVRLFAPSASAVVRHDRGEGTRIGGGVTFQPRDHLSVDLRAGYAFGRKEPDIQLEIVGGDVRPGSGVRAFWNGLRDLGPVAGASGAVSTFSSGFLDADYRDPWFASGVHLFHRVGGDEESGSVSLGVTARYEEHSRASFVLDGDPTAHRPLPEIDEGDLVAADLDLRTILGPGLALETGVTVASLGGGEWLEARGVVGWSRSWLAKDVLAEARVQGGLLTSRAPTQALYRLGGRGSLPGYPYRGFAGDRYGLLRASVSWGAASPWIRPRLLVAAGFAGGGDDPAPDAASIRPTGTTRISVGAGVGLFWDILRVDASRGMQGGGWEWVVSVNEEFWGFL